MNKYVVCFLMLLLFPAQVLGSTQVRALVDRTEIALGESLTLKVIITGDSGEVDTSVIKAFDIVSTASGTSISIVNGSTTKTREYAYTLIPRKTGTLTIPSLSVETDTGTLTTKAIPIVVTRESVSPSSDVPLFLRAELSEKQAYVGQQIVYTVSVFQAVNIANGRLEQPDLPTMHVEQVQDQKTFETTIKGRSFRVTQVSYVLTPNQVGELTIAPATLSCDVMTASSRRSGLDALFNDPFFSRGRRTRKRVRSAPIALTVLPLPAPPDNLTPFSGLIGQFSIHAAMNTTELTTGESTTLTITVQGSGNIQDVPPPRLALGKGCKTYADEPVTHERLTPLGRQGSKTFSHALVPTVVGTLTLGPIALNWFDPATGTYESMTTRPISMTVSQGEVQEAPPAKHTAPSTTTARPTKQDVTILHKDILPLYEGMDALKDSAPLSGSLFALFLLLPPLGLMGLWFVRHHVQGRTHPSKRYAGMASLLLKQACKPDADSLTLCFRSLMAAIASRTHSLSESLTYEEAQALVTQTTGNGELGNAVKNLMIRLDRARYGSSRPSQTAGDHTEQLVGQTRELVKKLCV